ncbi:MAG: hypothetical protein HZA77_08210 [Candidatus Schekmanbacteria bacterium]|nr:hypothetical protein [Candidatus Schekmanbacteria bacterium]
MRCVQGTHPTGRERILDPRFRGDDKIRSGDGKEEKGMGKGKAPIRSNKLTSPINLI